RGTRLPTSAGRQPNRRAESRPTLPRLRLLGAKCSRTTGNARRISVVPGPANLPDAAEMRAHGLGNPCQGFGRRTRRRWGIVDPEIKGEIRMYKLVLIRHGESDWNRENRFTGWTDVDLSEKGVQEAQAAGKSLKAEGFVFDIAYNSVLKRAIKTLNIVLEEMDLLWIP